MEAWCSWCKAVRPMEDVHYLETTGTGKRALEGHCGECGESMFTIGAVENETPQDLMGAKG